MSPKPPKSFLFLFLNVLYVIFLVPECLALLAEINFTLTSLLVLPVSARNGLGLDDDITAEKFLPGFNTD
jgi:hypothetical protein